MNTVTWRKQMDFRHVLYINSSVIFSYPSIMLFKAQDRSLTLPTDDNGQYAVPKAIAL